MIENLQPPSFLTVIPVVPADVLSRNDLIQWFEDVESKDDVSLADLRRLILFAATARGQMEMSMDALDYLAQSKISHLRMKVVEGWPSNK